MVMSLPRSGGLIVFLQFTPEAESFYGVKNFNLLGQNITIPGLSPKSPQAHCTYNGEICQVTTGEGGMSIISKHLTAIGTGLRFD